MLISIAHSPSSRFSRKNIKKVHPKKFTRIILFLCLLSQIIICTITLLFFSKQHRNNANQLNLIQTRNLNFFLPDQSFSGDMIISSVANGSEFIENSQCVRVVLPFIFSQFEQVLQNLDWWKRKDTRPCFGSGIGGECLHFHFLLDAGTNRSDSFYEVPGKINLALEQMIPQIDGCIRQVSHEIYYQGIDSYKNSAYEVVKHLIFDSNTLGYHKMAMFESDLYPVRAGWMNEIYHKAFLEPPFFIKGTMFEKNDSDFFVLNGHINGNCLWDVKDRTLLLELFNSLEEAISTMGHTLGYDVLLNLLFIKDKNSTICQTVPIDRRKAECFVAAGFAVPHQLEAIKTIYVDTPYVMNFEKWRRPSCQKLNFMNREDFLRRYSPHLFVHCNHKKIYTPKHNKEKSKIKKKRLPNSK